MASEFSDNGGSALYSGRVAFVTGGSSGIGLGIVEAFAEAGMRVALGYRSEEHAAAALTKLAPYRDTICAVRVDVTDRASMDAAVQEISGRLGMIHVLVHYAGVALLGSILDATPEDWAWQLGINLTGVVNGIQAVVPLMIRQGEGGHVIATSSIMGLFTAADHTAYSATKFGVVGLIEGLRLELEGTGVRASVFCPGNVWANLEVRTPGASASARRTDPDMEHRSGHGASTSRAPRPGPGTRDGTA